MEVTSAERFDLVALRKLGIQGFKRVRRRGSPPHRQRSWSPHCGNCDRIRPALKLDRSRFKQGLDGAKGFQDLAGNGCVDLDDGQSLHRLRSRPFAA